MKVVMQILCYHENIKTDPNSVYCISIISSTSCTSNIYRDRRFFSHTSYKCVSQICLFQIKMGKSDMD